MWPFSDFQYGIKSSRSTADLLTVVSDIIFRAFNRSNGATRVAVLDTGYRLMTEFGMLFFFISLNLMEFLGRYLALFLLSSVLDGSMWFWMGSHHKNIQLMLEFLKAPFLVVHFTYFTLITLMMMLSVILLSMLIILLSTLELATAKIGF